MASLSKSGNVSCIVGWNDIMGFKSVIESVQSDYLDREIVACNEEVREKAVGVALNQMAQADDVKAIAAGKTA